MEPAVSVIVVTYNARELIDRCLGAVFGAGGEGVALEVLVVDNASTDGTVEHVRTAWPQARIIETGRNGGMAAGNNAGMLEARGRAFLLCNADAFLEPGALATLVDRLDREPADAVACVAPALRNLDGSQQRSIRGFPTTWRYATELLFLRRMAPGLRATNAFYGAGIDAGQPGWVEWVTGACLLVPRSAVDAVGLMDEAYFMYGEEVDWLHRMAAAGRRVAWEPRASVVHVGGGSSGACWGDLYQRQLANHVRFMACRVGPGAARRTRAVLRAALLLRGVAWRVASVVARPRRRAGLRTRAAASLRGVRTVSAIDPARPEPARVPDWPALQREPAPGR